MSVQDLLNYEAIQGGKDTSGFTADQNGNLVELVKYLIANPGASPGWSKYIEALNSNPLYEGGSDFNAVSGTISFTAANDGIFVPVWVRANLSVVQLFWANGSVVSGNASVAIYDKAGTRLATSGAVACVGTTAFQKHTVSVNLTPGLHWLGLSCDNTTQQWRAAGRATGAGPIGGSIGGGAFRAASQHPCPATLPAPTAVFSNQFQFGASSDANFPIAVW